MTKKRIFVNLLVTASIFYSFRFVRYPAAFPICAGLSLLWWIIPLRFPKGRLVLLFALWLSMLLVPMGIRIQERKVGQHHLPNGGALLHDGAMQTEYAASLLLQGRNIYSEDTPDNIFPPPHDRLKYFGPHGQFTAIKNPALKHYLYPPLVILQNLPFVWAAQKWNFFFDQRLLTIPYLILVWFLIWRLPASKEDCLTAIYFITLNPYAIKFFLEGRNDIFLFFWLLLCFTALFRKSDGLALWGLAIACLLKQTSWPMVPFIYFYLYRAWQPISCKAFLIKALRESWKPFSFAALVMLPFISWDFHGLWQDLILFPSGTIATSYPVNGFSLLAILVRRGFYESPFAYYAIWKLQLPVYLAVLIYAYHRFKKSPYVDTLVLFVTLAMLLFWFLSRFFHDNYIEFMFKLLTVAWILRQSRKVIHTTHA